MLTVQQSSIPSYRLYPKNIGVLGGLVALWRRCQTKTSFSFWPHVLPWRQVWWSHRFCECTLYTRNRRLPNCQTPHLVNWVCILSLLRVITSVQSNTNFNSSCIIMSHQKMSLWKSWKVLIYFQLLCMKDRKLLQNFLRKRIMRFCFWVESTHNWNFLRCNILLSEWFTKIRLGEKKACNCSNH